MSSPRTVLDTNVVLSALLFKEGQLAWVRRAWQGGRFIPLISRATADELLRVLAYPKFRLEAGEKEALLGDYLPFCETVQILDPPPSVPTCRDPGDEIFLELSLSARADYLVSGDADLLTLAGEFPIPICAPEDWRKVFGL